MSRAVSLSLRVAARNEPRIEKGLKKEVTSLFTNFILMHKVIYLYILRCNDGTYYVGVTNNLERRLQEHGQGLSRTSYTYSRRPVTLVYSQVFTDFLQAFDWETRIKKWSKAKKEALIEGRYEDLVGLSKKTFNKY